MNLSFIKYELVNLRASIAKIEFKPQTVNANEMLNFSKLNQLNSELTRLKELNIFPEIVKSLQTNIYSKTTSDKLHINARDGNLIMGELETLIDSISDFINSLNSILPPLKPNTLFIKIPDTNVLQDFQEHINTYRKILTLTILDPAIEGEIIFDGVEPGSNWIKIYVRSQAAVALIGSLMWSSVVVYKKFQEGKIVEQLAIEHKLKNEEKKILIDAQRKLTSFIIDAEARYIYNNHYKATDENVDNEQIERLRQSIKMLSDEIEKGGEINPELTAPESVSNLFPDMKNLPAIESKIKRIENK